ncbi:hypothetical protein [Accumulibacter sp.]|uniref:hypothetical protein n=1 Tax=Accumulibacter sp. TaxID=2053492 RepID=UPI002CCA7B37|nr:hypothetical protein [Accumulibacter sp.]HPU81570.1 hypothetical protein [Accumulibacter sp.]
MTSKSGASIKSLAKRLLQNLFVVELSGLLRRWVAAVGKRRAALAGHVCNKREEPLSRLFSFCAAVF